MLSQAEKGRLFKERHAKPGILLLPNPWDAGTAKLNPNCCIIFVISIISNQPRFLLR